AEAVDVLDDVLVRDGHGEINASGVLSVDVRPDLVALDPELRHRWRSRREAIVRTKLVDDAGQGAVVFQQRNIAELAGRALRSAHVEPGAICAERSAEAVLAALTEQASADGIGHGRSVYAITAVEACPDADLAFA